MSEKAEWEKDILKILDRLQTTTQEDWKEIRAAVQRALNEARADEHDNHQCMGDGDDTCYCGRSERLRKQAAEGGATQEDT